MFGSLLSSIVKVVNVPLSVIDKGLDLEDEDRIFSAPLNAVAEELEKIDS